MTPATTLAAARRASHIMLGRHELALADLIERLSLSARIAAPSDALLASLAADRELLPEVWHRNQTFSWL